VYAEPIKSPALTPCLLAWILILGGLQTAPAEVIYWPSAADLARQRALSIGCVNNLHDILSAAQNWHYDHGFQFPSNFQTFSNYLNSPAVFFCPADLSRSAVTNWSNFDWSNLDYQWIPQRNWDNPNAVCCRCRIHDNVGLVGGFPQVTNTYRVGWPAIIAAPMAQDVTPGSDVRFEVRIASNAVPPISYQWRREQLYFVTNVIFVSDTNGGYYVTNRRGAFWITNLVGQTNPVYLINAASTNASDYYSVLVSNTMGTTASAEVRLRMDSTNAVMAASDFWSARNCQINLREIGFFMRIWAQDHQSDNLPQSFSEATNAFGSPIFGWPTVLFCRADKARTAPPDWPGLDLADTSYELLPGDDQDSNRVLRRCKVHGLYVQSDGTVPSLPIFSKVRRLGGNATELTMLVLSSSTNILEASSNLLDWNVLTNYSGASGTFLFYETNTASRRFYRMRLP